MTDDQWAKLSDRGRDAKVAEALWPEGRPLGHPLRISEMLASTWAGAGLVIDEVIKSGPSDTELTLTCDGGCSTATWWRDGTAFDAVVEGPPDKAAPSATALAAVRAMEAE